MSDNSAQLQKALVLHQQGKLSDAEAIYRTILSREPHHTGALHYLGIAAHQRGQYGEAAQLIGLALISTPSDVGALSNHGNALLALGQPDEALASFDRAVAVKPDFVEALYNRGNALLALGRLEEAWASFDRALAIKPDFAEALYNRGNALLAMRRLDAALASYDRALAIRPHYAEALTNRGSVLVELNLLDAALVSYDRALAIKPGFAEALYNRANAFFELQRVDEALTGYDQALAIKPDYADALYNRGNALFELRRLDEALASYGRALALKPDFAEADFNAARCRLLSGDFANGWEKYERRWQSKPLKGLLRDFARPLWLGKEYIAGKTILLHIEQGMGDTIQFCRYAPQLAERGARIVLEVQPELKSLLAGLEGVDQVIAAGEAFPAFDLQCPLMSLPLAFDTAIDTIPAPIPYLRAAPELVSKWRAVLGEKTGPRVGLVWSGNPEHKNDRNRSIAASLLTPLISSGVNLISLQKSYRADDRQWLAAHPEVRHFGNDLHDFADTAALASLMDVVVTVDTSVAHLAGAMGLPVWILLPHAGLDWRWLLDRDDSPWYPTARLYRQSAPKTWDAVIARVARDLKALRA